MENQYRFTLHGEGLGKQSGAWRDGSPGLSRYTSVHDCDVGYSGDIERAAGFIDS